MNALYRRKTPSNSTQSILFELNHLHLSASGIEIIQKKRNVVCASYRNRIGSPQIESLKTLNQSQDNIAHMFYIELEDETETSRIRNELWSKNIFANTHYQPLATSKSGKVYGREYTECIVANSVSRRLLRLPLWTEMNSELSNSVILELNTLSPKYLNERESNENK